MTERERIRRGTKEFLLDLLIKNSLKIFLRNSVRMFWESNKFVNKLLPFAVNEAIITCQLIRSKLIFLDCSDDI